MKKPYTCETCANISCWLCSGNPYYVKVMTLTNKHDEHRTEIAEFREFVKYKGCVSHSDFPGVLDSTSDWYKNCKRQREVGAKICESCPFKSYVETLEEAEKNG